VTPTQAYRRLNAVLWLNRLPAATVILIDNATIPHIHGITMHDGRDLFLKPVILINRGDHWWGRTLIHEMLHVAEPELPHGKIFDAIAKKYWRIAKKRIKLGGNTCRVR